MVISRFLFTKQTMGDRRWTTPHPQPLRARVLAEGGEQSYAIKAVEGALELDVVGLPFGADVSVSSCGSFRFLPIISHALFLATLTQIVIHWPQKACCALAFSSSPPKTPHPGGHP